MWHADIRFCSAPNPNLNQNQLPNPNFCLLFHSFCPVLCQFSRGWTCCETRSGSRSVHIVQCSWLQVTLCYPNFSRESKLMRTFTSYEFFAAQWDGGKWVLSYDSACNQNSVACDRGGMQGKFSLRMWIRHPVRVVISMAVRRRGDISFMGRHWFESRLTVILQHSKKQWISFSSINLLHVLGWDIWLVRREWHIVFTLDWKRGTFIVILKQWLIAGTTISYLSPSTIVIQQIHPFHYSPKSQTQS